MMLRFVQSMNVLLINFIQFSQFLILVLKLSNAVLQHFNIKFRSFFSLLLLFTVYDVFLLFDQLALRLCRVLITPVPSEVVILLRADVRGLVDLWLFLVYFIV